MLTRWSLQGKAEILHLDPWHWIWEVFMRNRGIVEPRNCLCSGFSHFFNLFPQVWSSPSIIHEGFEFRKEEGSVNNSCTGRHCIKCLKIQPRAGLGHARLMSHVGLISSLLVKLHPFCSMLEKHITQFVFLVMLVKIP